jgi:hypothetical protein
MNQGIQSQEETVIHKLKDELLNSERNRIALLETLLKNNNIEF